MTIVKRNNFSDFLHQNLTNAVATSVFSQNLKNTNVSSVFSKGDSNCETNYRPVSILPNISKVYERQMPLETDAKVFL